MNVRDRLDIISIEKRAFIGGKYVPAKSGEVIKKYTSYDGKLIDGIASCGEEDVNEAVEAAKNSFERGVWRNLDHAERKEIMIRLADLMEKHREELALLDTYETGRAYRNYYYDSIPKAIEAVRYFAESVDKYYDAAIPAGRTEFGVISRVPLGVVGLITPWNDPMVVAAWKYAPALLMGNSVVFKPAELSSLSAIKLAALTKEAGIPDGVFNVVPGYGETAGRALALHPDVRGIFFTGSRDVGKQILIYSGQSNMKKVGLECGGKGPYIVTDQCKDVPRAAKILAENMFYNQGQICSAPSKAIIMESVFDDFMNAFKKESEQFVPGDPFDDENIVGCTVSREQFEKIQRYIEIGKKDGLKVFQAQKIKEHHPDACCVQPTIISELSPDHILCRDEIFGPVIVVLKAKTVEEAVKYANDTCYGLAGAVWTDNIDEAYYFSRMIDVGLFHINSYGNDDNRSPFGGVKESGIGKDKSMYAFDEYSDLKTVWMHFEK